MGFLKIKFINKIYYENEIEITGFLYYKNEIEIPNENENEIGVKLKDFAALKMKFKK